MITIEINDADISDALGRAVALLTDMSPLMNNIGAHLRDATEDRFKTGTAPDGSPWTARSPVTLARYTKLGLTYGAHPLTLSGDLSNSIAHSYGPDFAMLTTKAKQAAVMQFGAPQGAFGAFIGKDKLGRDHFHSIPWGNIPARPFFGIAEEDRTNILDIVAEYLEAVLQP